MRVLVTGASGYVASNVVHQLLNDQHEVIILVRPTSSLSFLASLIDIHQIKIAYYEDSFDSVLTTFNTYHPEIVFHIASCFIAEHQSTQLDILVDANIRFGLHILEAMKETGVKKLVNTGTSWQYYHTDHYDPVCLYAATKKAFEDLAFFYHQAYGFNILNLIIYDTYGPNDPRKKLLSVFKQAEISREPIKMSPGDQKIDLVHIDDIKSAYSTALKLIVAEPPCFKHYALKTGHAYSLKEIAAIYAKARKVQLNIEWGGRPYRKREVMIPSQSPPILPDWRAYIKLEWGLAL